LGIIPERNVLGQKGRGAPAFDLTLLWNVSAMVTEKCGIEPDVSGNLDIISGLLCK
jgi:hypothetical protein